MALRASECSADDKRARRRPATRSTNTGDRSRTRAPPSGDPVGVTTIGVDPARAAPAGDRGYRHLSVGDAYALLSAERFRDTCDKGRRGASRRRHHREQARSSLLLRTRSSPFLKARPPHSNYPEIPPQAVVHPQHSVATLAAAQEPPVGLDEPEDTNAHPPSPWRTPRKAKSRSIA